MLRLFAKQVSLRMLLASEDWVSRAEAHRSKSRAQHMDPSDVFLVTSTNDHSRPTHAASFSETDVASSIALQYCTPSWLPRDELEATTIFDFQTRHLLYLRLMLSRR